MPQLNGKEVKEQIKRTIDSRGPSLPVHISKAISMSSLFASAFLSELASEGIIKISHMKVGGSPLYFLPGQETKLENFFNFLSPKEREAVNLLKEKRILEDDSQHPAIRVALRALKDFAFAFKKGEKLLWRYFLVSEDEARNFSSGKIEVVEKIEEKKIEEKTPALIEDNKIKITEPTKKEIEVQQVMEIKKEGILELKTEQKIVKISKPKKSKTKKINDNFLNEVKALLTSKNIELIKVESFDIKQVFARIKTHDKEYLLGAFNKKKIEDSDLIKAHKKAGLLGLDYYILSKGELNKKTKEAVDAYRKLAGTLKILPEEKSEE